EKLDSQFLQTMQVGVGRRNKFYENIISVPLPRYTNSPSEKCNYICSWSEDPTVNRDIIEPITSLSQNHQRILHY
ncbi:hypothetical protein, partial [Staphylococcus aureus]|uniref:hypothetical protein n=1 Tax=Staphylococcus aureus TaxID=1280 RepID=UPI001CD93A26